MRGGSWIFPTTRWSHYLIDAFTCRRCLCSVRPHATRGGDIATIHHTTPEAVAHDCITLCGSCNSAVGHPYPDHAEAGSLWLAPTNRTDLIRAARPYAKLLYQEARGAVTIPDPLASNLRAFIERRRTLILQGAA